MRRVTSASYAMMSAAAAAARMTMPLREREPVAAGVQLARQEAVPGEDRPEDREAVEGRVGGEDEDEAGDDRHEDDAGRGSR